jgi:ligand-binding sensor domain-containing protein
LASLYPQGSAPPPSLIKLSPTGGLLGSFTPPANFTSPLCVDANDNLWFGTASGLVELGSNGSPIGTFLSGTINQVVTDPAGHIWATTDGHLYELSTSGSAIADWSIPTSNQEMATSPSGKVWIIYRDMANAWLMELVP